MEYISSFLKTELTIIPRLLDRYFGKYYSNFLCNAATWMFAIWYILHSIFDSFLNILLKQMKFKEYIRIRIIQSLWYLGFYSTAFIYCTLTLIRNNILILKTEKPFDANTSYDHLILGFIVVLTFYLHSACWERLKYSYGLRASTYLCFFFLLCSAYFLRFMEGIFKIITIICVSQIFFEVTRCVIVVTKPNTFGRHFIIPTFFIMCMAMFIFSYVIVIPLCFIYPIIKNFTPYVSILLTCLLIWLFDEIYASALVKCIFHLIFHDKEDKKCYLDIFECSLFPTRLDATYNFVIFKKEVLERQEKCTLLRKPRNKTVVYQTLKCMVAIKRKLSEKRQNRINLNESQCSSNLKSDREKMSNNDLILNSEETNVDEEVNDVQVSSNSENEKDCKRKMD